MRGRWKTIWDALLAGKTVTEEGVVAVEVEKKVGMAGLMGGYGSDSEESGSGSEAEGEKAGEAEETEAGEEAVAEVGCEEAPVEVVDETEEEKEKKRRRKEKALEWARKRKEGASTEEFAEVPAASLPSPVADP